MKIGKIIGAAVAGTVLFVAGGICGSFFANRSLGIEGELNRTRVRLGKYYTGPQSEMTMLSEFQLDLVTMELSHVRYAICNQPGYENIEKDFIRNESEWNKVLESEQRKPSESEGGSLAPMDHHLRMVNFLQTRINDLNANWRRYDNAGNF